MPGTVLLMQNVLLGQTKVMKIRQRETLSHQGAIIHEFCLSSAQLKVLTPTSENNFELFVVAGTCRTVDRTMRTKGQSKQPVA